MPLQDLGKLRPETDAQRDIQAKVTPADVEELRSRMEGFSTPGEILNRAGMIEITSAAKTRAMFFAESQSTGIVGAFMDWLEGQSK
ncbi:MAG: hypothetical protein KY445_08510 [Armatimonadetes bacterium]|nr:hypothetical protein [Armatimonadota bacterium]